MLEETLVKSFFERKPLAEHSNGELKALWRSMFKPGNLTKKDLEIPALTRPMRRVYRELLDKGLAPETIIAAAERLIKVAQIITDEQSGHHAFFRPGSLSFDWKKPLGIADQNGKPIPQLFVPQLKRCFADSLKYPLLPQEFNPSPHSEADFDLSAH